MPRKNKTVTMTSNDDVEDVLSTAVDEGESDSSNDEKQKQGFLDLTSPNKDKNEVLVCGCG